MVFTYPPKFSSSVAITIPIFAEANNTSFPTSSGDASFPFAVILNTALLPIPIIANREPIANGKGITLELLIRMNALVSSCKVVHLPAQSQHP